MVTAVVRQAKDMELAALAHTSALSHQALAHCYDNVQHVQYRVAKEQLYSLTGKLCARPVTLYKRELAKRHGEYKEQGVGQGLAKSMRGKV